MWGIEGCWWVSIATAGAKRPSFPSAERAHPAHLHPRRASRLALGYSDGPHHQVAIAADCLNTFACLVLRQLGLLDIVVFRGIDFVPRRFDNRAVEAVYRRVERFAAEHADVSWVLTRRMAEARRTMGGVRTERAAPRAHRSDRRALSRAV